MSLYVKYRVKIRRGGEFRVKPEAEQLDGNTYEFRIGWTIDNDGTSLPIVGEKAMIPNYAAYPVDAPTWIASGDLEEVI